MTNEDIAKFLGYEAYGNGWLHPIWQSEDAPPNFLGDMNLALLLSPIGCEWTIDFNAKTKEYHLEVWSYHDRYNAQGRNLPSLLATTFVHILQKEKHDVTAIQERL